MVALCLARIEDTTPVLPSPWQRPLDDIAERVIETLLEEHIIHGIGCLAATCQSWQGLVLNSEELWKQGLKKRWGVWLGVDEPSSIGDLIAQLQDEETSAKCGPKDMPASWQSVYLLWNRAVEQAVEVANGALNVAALHRASKAKSSPRALWAHPKPPQIEYTAWRVALDAMTSSRIGVKDAEKYFLAADNALLNLLGVHYLMLMPWAPPALSALYADKVDTEKITAMVQMSGCGHKRVAVRWWELGVLMMGAGWRTGDQMHTMEGPLCEILEKQDLWRLLLHGPRMEVRRIVVEAAD
mmetsp:Transcript_2064/g.6109  ORF Transcript_2064/g.6109 Transcript_2064/m.6109 type:complete len:298 (-) Transcript_2064:90-983(-)